MRQRFVVAAVIGLAAVASAHAAGESARPPHVLWDTGPGGSFVDQWRPEVLAAREAQRAARAAEAAARRSPRARAAQAEARAHARDLVWGYVGLAVPAVTAQGEAAALSWPLPQTRLAAGFGRRARRAGTFERHTGISFRNDDAVVRAAAAGMVAFAGTVPGLGETVVVAHGAALHTVYAGLAELTVRAGDAVAATAPLGRGGVLTPTGARETYFEVRRDGVPIDPVPLLPR